ncbi:DUF4405 domain-containing protein [Myxococcota bacterium]|nr:DUF4405 domain-containing protein [Myxococcota bacterium]
MKRTTLNQIIDLLAAVFFLGMIATGYILYFPLPPGTNKSHLLWSLTRHRWGEIHAWLGLGVLAILFLHLALHWSWIVVAVSQRLGLTRDPQAKHLKSGIITALVLLGILGAFAWITQVSVKEQTTPCCPPKQRRKAPISTTPSRHPSSPATPHTAQPRIQPTIPTQRVPAAPPIEYWKDVYPRLASACLRCHGPNKTRGGFRLDRREDYFGSNENAALVLPRNSAQSPLLSIVKGERPSMAAAEAHKLPPRDIDLLRAWIDAGALWSQRAAPKKQDAP